MTAATTAAAGTVASHDFNGPDTVWQPLEDGAPMRVLAHECTGGGARDNAGCEHVALVAPAGQSAQLACATEPIAVLDELEARMWVKATRPGVQLAARIALPRSVGVRNQSPVTVIVRGEQYDRVGRWQQLVLADVPKRLAEQVRVLRTVPGASVDAREAYVDAVLLMVPGGPDATEVWTDDLDVDGVVLDRASGVQPAAFTAAAAAPQPSTIRLQGGTLLVDGHALLPRVIEWRGEPLQFLAERGFNTVQLAALPTVELAADARRSGLWFFCPPPRPDDLAHTGIGPTSDRVLAWSLADEIGNADPNYLRRWADLVRQVDPVSGRPVVVVPESDWENARKGADVIIARHLLAGRMSAADFSEWLASRPQFADPGTPLWVCLPTQFGAAVTAQCAALGRHSALPPNIDDQQLEALVRIAAAQGCRGCIFSSQQSLAEKDPGTRRRAALLELVNHRLQLIEPWLAGGKVVGRVQSSDSAWSAALLHVDYARLLMPLDTDHIRAIPTSNPTPADALAGRAFVVPGVPESSQVFQLSPVELRSVSAQRVTGGMRTVWDADEDGLMLLTEDPQVISNLRQRTAQNGVKVARLERDLAIAQAVAVADTARGLTPLGVAGDEAARVVSTVNAQLRQVDPLIAAGRVPDAYRLARLSRQTLLHAADAQRRAVGTPMEFGTYALMLSYDQLVDHAQATHRVASLRGGDNLLFGGDFEDIGQLTTAGWQHVSHPIDAVEARAELSATNPQHGRYCLELRATASKPKQLPTFIASPPIWITSPPVPVEKGQIIEVTGWVRIDEAIALSVDGLQIVDALGGPELTLTVGQTSGWQPFQMIRAVPESTDLRLTFALTGLGTAHVDGVMIRILQQPVARRLPPVGAAQGSGVFFDSTTSR